MTRRLGQVLVDAGALTGAQLAVGLRAQVMYGGRLGTNLVELDLIDLDTLSRTLAIHHGVPAALAHHFADTDPELQQRLSPDTARRLECVPLRHVFARRHGVVIASAAPLDDAARAAVAEELLIHPAQLILAIAAEMRIKYHLERVYQIARAPRFLRVRGATLPAPVDAPAPERRGYLEPSADALIATARLARGSQELAPVRRDAAPDPDAEARRLARALEAIRGAAGRDALGALALEALDQCAPGCSGAMLLAVRGGAAIAWQRSPRLGARGAHIVIPLGISGAVGDAARRRTSVRREASTLASIDRALLHLLGRDDGELVVVPIVVAGEVASLLAAAVEPGAAADAIEAVAAASVEAFARMLLRHAAPGVTTASPSA